MGSKKFIAKMSELVKTANEYHDRKDRSDETNTVVKFVISLFNLFGWDTTYDMEFEYRGKKGKPVDLALIVNGQAKVLIEVKSIDHDLTDEVAKQAVAYLVEKNVRWGVITNGIEIRCYDMKHMQKKSGRGREVFRISLENFEKYDNKKATRITEILSILSKYNVTRDYLEHIGNNFLDSHKSVWQAFKGAGIPICSDEIRMFAVHSIIKSPKIYPFRTREKNVMPKRNWSREEIFNFLDRRAKKSRVFFKVLAKYSNPATYKEIAQKMAEALSLPKVDSHGIAGYRGPCSKLGREDIVE